MPNLPRPTTVAPSEILSTAGGWQIIAKSTWLDNSAFQNPADMVKRFPHTEAIPEAIDWTTVSGGPVNLHFGAGNDVVARRVNALGSRVYGTALLRKDVVNIFGIRVTNYRYVIIHSQVPLVMALVFADLVVPFAIFLIASYLISQAGGLQNLLGSIANFLGVVIHESITPITNTLIWTTLFTVVGTGLIYLIVYPPGHASGRPPPPRPGPPGPPAMPEPPKVAVEATSPRFKAGPLTTPGVAVGTGRTPSVPQPTEFSLPRGRSEAGERRRYIRQRVTEQALSETGARRRGRRG